MDGMKEFIEYFANFKIHLTVIFLSLLVIALGETFAAYPIAFLWSVAFVFGVIIYTLVYIMIKEFKNGSLY